MDTEARTVLITGSTSGLGRELTLRLAADGWTVLAHGRDRGRLDEVCRLAGPGVRPLVADLASLEEGVAATLRLITDPDLAEVTGEFFDGLRPGRSLPEAYDPDFRARLRAVTAQVLAGYPGAVDVS